MRFSEAWLLEWVDPAITTEQLSEQLSMAGLEVDAVEPAAPAFSGVVVGEVLTREQHPDADKLSVCSVDVGTDANVAAQQHQRPGGQRMTRACRHDRYATPPQQPHQLAPVGHQRAHLREIATPPRQ